MKKNDCNPEQQNDCCDTTDQSCCSTPEPAKNSSWKKMSAILVLSLAIVFAISAVVKAGAPVQFSALASNGCGLPSITDFKWMETDEKVAFIFLKGNEEASNTILESKLESVYSELKESGGSASLLIIDETNEHFSEIKEECKVKSLPAVITLGRGCQSSVLTDNINSTRLIKAYMLASTPAGSCSSGSSSCCSKSKK